MVQHVVGALMITIALPLFVGLILMIVVGSIDEMFRHFLFHDSMDGLMV